ncbi:MAG: oligopeptide/dipeptide ABC transporter ATP-binding protein [Ndongobacter sp.]|nr:oligopeptide/dipeptide ABC transporter ATP-binding protein [Ndongobacter sp.]
MSEPILQIKNLKKYFPVRGKKGQMVHAVDDVSFEIPRGKTLGLVGESGCGKSSCARTIIRIHDPDEGQILLDGVDVTGLSPKEMLPHRKKMQMIFQDPYSSLNARMTVRDIIAEPLQAHHLCKNKKEEDELVFEMLEKVGLSHEHAGRYAHEFSGGQRQRIGIARAIVLRPELVICDEPISALDVSIQAQIVNLLSDFQKELKLSYLFIAHDLSMVRYVSDEVGVMYLGKLVERCTADEIYRKPLHPYTEGLLASIPIPDPRRRTLETEAGIQGDLPNPINLPEGCRFRNRCPKAMALCSSVEPVLQEVSPNHQVACHLYGACQTGTTPEE